MPQGSVSGPLLFKLFNNDLRYVIKQSKHLFFADDLTIFRAIYCVQDMIMLPSDIKLIQGWCTANFKGVNSSKNEGYCFSQENICSLLYSYIMVFFYNPHVHYQRTWVTTRFKPLFPRTHVYYICSQTVRMQGLI